MLNAHHNQYLISSKKKKKIEHVLFHTRVSLVAQMVKNLPAVGRPGLDPWVGKTPRGGCRNPLWYSCPGTEEPGRLQSTGPQ